MKHISSFVCCLFLLISNSSFADVRIRLLFDGAPFVANAKPEFACLDDSNQQWFDCGLTRTEKPGEYKRKNLAVGSYVILIGVDENRNNLKNMPGDWRADYRFKITSSNDGQIVDVPMAKLIHLVKPQSNNGPMAGALGAGCKDKPLFIPAGHPWTDKLAIPFEWESIIKDANYKISVVRRHCDPFKELGVFRQFETKETFLTLTLPPNSADEYYAFFISAFRDGRFVGDLLTYDSGAQSWSYGFKIEPVSTPTSYYLAAVTILLVLALSWFVMSYLGLGIAYRVLIHLILIILLILGQKMIPNAKLFPRRAQKPSATFFGENVAWEKYTHS